MSNLLGKQLYCETKYDDGIRILLRDGQKCYYATSNPYWTDVIITRAKAKNKNIIRGNTPITKKDEN